MAVSMLTARQPCPINSKHHHHRPFVKTYFSPSLGALRARPNPTLVRASFLESPGQWVGRLFAFYALLKSRIAGIPSNRFNSPDSGGSDGDLGFSKWVKGLHGTAEPGDGKAISRRKLVTKWQPTAKGTLKRSYRVATKAEGRRLLKSIAALLSGDDHFLDAASHKGCLIRRESAHGESVCGGNVRALFDELPTPRLHIEITPFPAGLLTEGDYATADKIERVLRSGASI